MVGHSNYSLNKKSEAVTNFVFPVLDTSGDEKNKLKAAAEALFKK